MQKLLTSFDKFTFLKKAKKIAVAVSGGIDSMALVFLMQKWLKQNKLNNTKLIAITVDHKLRPSSTKESEYVHNLMRKNNIEHYTLTWADKKPSSNLELHARNARYELLTNFCKKESIEYLLIAHHLQDQAETFLIRLFRGSGIDGLASMQNINELNGVKIVRPLLDVTKEELKDYLETNKIKWVEDESNEDEKYMRNKIRKFLNSFDNKEDIVNRISSTVNEIAKARSIIEGELVERAKDIIEFSEFGYCTIDLQKFIELDKDLGLRLLAWIVMDVSGNEYKPRLEKLERVYNKLVSEKSRKDLDKKQTFYGCCFYEYEKGRVIFYRETSKIKRSLKDLGNNELLWDGRFIIKGIGENFNKDNLKIINLTPQKLNGLMRAKKVKEWGLKKFAIPKEIFYTIPVVEVLEKIAEIPHIRYRDEKLLGENKGVVGVKYKFRTPLVRIGFSNCHS